MSQSHVGYSEITDETLYNTIIRCPYSKCGARIIKPSTDQQIETLRLESIDFLKPSESTSEANDGKFLQIKDAWDFDNIAVSREFKAKENEEFIERLIVCADCERGPLGFARFEEGEESKDVKNLRYFLHLNSVVFQKTI